jgi:hypothetical protein
MTHLNDAQILLLIDHPPEPGSEGDDARRHADACDRCSAGLARMREDAALFTGWLDAAAFEAGIAPAATAPVIRPRRPTRWIPGGWLRAAAVLVAMAAPVVAMPSGRAWLAAKLGGDAGSPTAAVQSAPAALTTPSVIRFEPTGGTLLLTLDAVQAAGSVAVRHGTGIEAVLEITGDAGMGPVVSGGGVRIRNDSGSRAGYTLLVPGSVRRVTVRIAEGAPVHLDEAALRAGATVSAAGR